MRSSMSQCGATSFQARLSVPSDTVTQYTGLQNVRKPFGVERGQVLQAHARDMPGSGTATGRLADDCARALLRRAGVC